MSENTYQDERTEIEKAADWEAANARRELGTPQEGDNLKLYGGEHGQARFDDAVKAAAEAHVKALLDSQVPNNPQALGLGGIVDKDFVGTHAPVEFIFVGTSMGNECNQCGTMVRTSGEDQHRTFHGLVNGVLDYNGVQA